MRQIEKTIQYLIGSGMVRSYSSSVSWPSAIVVLLIMKHTHTFCFTDTTVGRAGAG